MDAEQRSVFQGIVYYYRENMVNCRYQVTLKDAVDGALLQQALDAARAKAPYYFQKPVWEKKLLHAWCGRAVQSPNFRTRTALRSP